ncbi:MAG TPA: RbsD/FucU domain-containing protein [Acetobacteraceae bacterium]|nr:RbsD/FucU domain-containing protein [Acetobacteraceae bacterium]
MLRGIPPLLTPDLLHALAAMGHGDRIAIVDANFPAAALAQRLVELPGVDASAVLEAVLTLMPLDDFIPDPACVMQVVGDPHEVPDAVRDFTTILARHRAGGPTGLERHAFYRTTENAFVVVRTGERRLYGNILLSKGVIRP